MTKKDLLHIWEYHYTKNEKNTMDLIPCGGLASFIVFPCLRIYLHHCVCCCCCDCDKELPPELGFPEPTPKSLCGILNANALFTCCIGIWQLAYGALFFLVPGELNVKWDAWTVGCIGASLISCLLTVMNAAMDFNSKLVMDSTEPPLKGKRETSKG